MSILEKFTVIDLIKTRSASVATITVSGKNVTAKGVKAGTAQIIIMTNEGQKVAICNLTVTAA